MRCIICDGWSEDALYCSFCDASVCEECIVENDSGDVFCSEECQTELYMN